MSDIAIRVEHLSKLYHIGRARRRHDTLRDALVGTFKRFNVPTFQRSNVPTSEDDTLWALKDVSFEVQRGEVVGVIGRNGAGKSTLLKILSRITEPTSGRAEIHGRVGSLLEVGTGFHPELTGRENIYLNGAILGMKRVEIGRKFDEIVAFAEIERFLDMPVKHYSSGMYVRLAFAVAAHLEPEILLVDEVLAVGDAAFQKKALGKMGEVTQEGRTVLFVSHNMTAILSLCSQAYLLHNGVVLRHGNAEDVVAKYMEDAFYIAETTPLQNRTDRRGSGEVKLTSISINSYSGRPDIRCGDRLRICVGYAAGKPLRRAHFMLKFCDQFNRPVFLFDSAMVGQIPEELPASGYVTCITEPINLVPDIYTVNAAIMVSGNVSDNIKQICAVEINEDDFYGTGKLPGRQDAVCLLRHQWLVEGSVNNEIA